MPVKPVKKSLMKPIFFGALLLLIANTGFTQNLVSNPGFEEFFSCPNSINNNKTNSKIAPHWNSPSFGTPDLYNRCSKYRMGTQNVTGFTDPFSGDGFAGIIIWEGKKGFREYLQVKLSEPLKADGIYIVSFYYKLSSYSKYSADRICFSLTGKSVFHKVDTAIPEAAANCKIKSEAMDPYTGTWELSETEYTAKGGEEYLTIGNFSNNSSTKTAHLFFKNSQEPMLENAAYYYIDEVSVSEKKAIDTTWVEDNTRLNNKKIELSDTYVLENVLFAHNSDTLLPQSFAELDQVIEILNRNPEWKVKISGHTDGTGSAQYNQELSERRAYSVKEYLLLNKISAKRIQAKGYGKSKPLVTGSEVESQEKNRRVEVEFY